MREMPVFNRQILMKIINLPPNNQALLEQAAAVLYEGFKEHYPTYIPNTTVGKEKVQQFIDNSAWICRLAVEGDLILGWIGGIPEYDGNVYILNPIVVRLDYQGQGIGRALVMDLEEQVRLKCGLTIHLGTDDENNRTSLGGKDLYSNVWEHVAKIQNLDRHPYEFYQKLGYVIVGVVPDANGWGKPDIMMAKRIASKTD